jgi:predicted dehydrogenase
VRSIGRTLKALPLGALGLRYGGDFVDSYRAEWRHFIDATRTNTPIESTLEDERLALQVALAVLKSISTDQPVKLQRASETSSRASANKEDRF